MFVESMTFEEMRKEFEKEKRALLGKIVHHSNKVLKLMNQTNMNSYDKHFDYLSPNKNRWVYHFVADKKGRNHFRIDTYCYFQTNKSYAVISYAVEIDRLFYISSHFLTRYFERQNLTSDNMHDLIRTYYRNNANLITQAIKEEKPGTGIWQVFVQTSTGVGLGYLYNNCNIVEMRTFITNDMLKGNQVEMSKQLEEKFKIHIVRSSPALAISEDVR
jgi:hypothetical protein